MKSRSGALYTTLSIIALAAPVAVQAQESAEGTGGIADIVVTAQKRSTSLQKTAAAITALSDETLKQSGIKDLAQVQTIVPAARFHQEGNTIQVFLRGVGSNLDFANVETTVAFNFNGTFIPREGASVGLYDLETLEVLPGPQGTLYGRSALGGVINVNFRRPSHNWETTGLLEAGNFDFFHASFAQNVPLGDSLAMRFAGDFEYNDGLMSDGSFSKKNWGARLGVVYDPADDVNVYLWGYAAQKRGHPANLVNKGTNPDTGAYDEGAFLGNDPWDTSWPNRTLLFPGGPTLSSLLGTPEAENQIFDNYAVGAQVDIGVADDVTLTYIPSYFYLNNRTFYWLGSIRSGPYRSKYDQTNHELRLSGSGDKLDWLVGVNGFHAISSGSYVIFINTTPLGAAFGLPSDLPQSSVTRLRNQGAAIFGEATYSVSPEFRIVAGGRYSYTRKKARGNSLPEGVLASVGAYTGPIPEYTFKRSFKHFDYKLGVEYDVASNAMAYFTYQTGYGPGTFNEYAPGTPVNNSLNLPQDNLVKPAKLFSWTAGIKFRTLDNRLQINNEVFYYIYKDLLMQAYNVGAPVNTIFNAKKVEIYGNQLDISFRPTPNDMITAYVSYLHNRNKDFVDTTTNISYNGISGPYSADWTIGANVYHDFQFDSGYLRLQADARYESEWFADFVHNPGTRQAPYVKANGSITWYSDSGTWNAGIWCRNITDKAVIAATAAAGIPGPATAYMDEPRTYGVRMGFNF
ncbi:MAG: TonB-dependent receptor [Sphingobium sp.]|nr:TonB-dependent receptor [Sphingobium sp.]MCP5400115.1 TonB-dependent receptor [Sphingomonas sp.]